MRYNTLFIFFSYPLAYANCKLGCSYFTDSCNWSFRCLDHFKDPYTQTQTATTYTAPGSFFYNYMFYLCIHSTGKITKTQTFVQRIHGVSNTLCRVRTRGLNNAISEYKDKRHTLYIVYNSVNMSVHKLLLLTFF